MGSHWESYSWLEPGKGAERWGLGVHCPLTSLRDVQGVDIGYKNQSLLPTGCPSHQ